LSAEVSSFPSASAARLNTRGLALMKQFSSVGRSSWSLPARPSYAMDFATAGLSDCGYIESGLFKRSHHERLVKFAFDCRGCRHARANGQGFYRPNPRIEIDVAATRSNSNLPPDGDR
jgi:hypothetical protein